jgi:transcriptional antiterminator RfaH
MTCVVDNERVASVIDTPQPDRESGAASPERGASVMAIAPASSATIGAPVPWYVVYSKPHREHLAQLHLHQRGFEVFYPQLQLPEYVKRSPRWVPLFPNYLFVRIHLMEQIHDVVWAPGVKCLVGAGGIPLPLDPDVVAFLKRNATPDGRLPARPDLRRGQEVEITDGPLAGLIAIIERPPDARGRIRVLMKLLNRRPTRVQVPIRFVKSGWVA